MTSTPSTSDMLKAWVQYRQHTLGSNMRNQVAEDEFWAFINDLIFRSLARGWDAAADNLGEHAEVDDDLIDLADNLRGANPYREQETTHE